MVKKPRYHRRTIAELRTYFPLDWSMQRRYSLPSGDVGQPYYIHYPGTRDPNIPWQGIAFDSVGVVVVRGLHNPVTVAQYALYSYERLLRGVPRSEETFFTQIEWLVKAQPPDGSYFYDLALPDYGVERGFISAMAQGLAASALVRAYVLTRRERYREAAIRACELLKRDVRDGGVTFLNDENVFFEEVASAWPCHILNGHLFAAFGLWDLARLGLADGRLCDLHERAVRTLREWLPYFDCGDWSYYHLAVRNRRRCYANIVYHQLHIAQLHIYAAMTGVERFERTAQRWESGLRRPRVRARVLFNSVAWLSHVVARRIGIEQRTRWMPMKITG